MTCIKMEADERNEVGVGRYSQNLFTNSVLRNVSVPG
jgi:hypothetical protein